MAALHGREDPLLEAARFARLLRQANDAEVADVRKVGDEDYEVSLHRGRGAPAPSQRAPAAPLADKAAEPAGTNGAAPTPAPAPEAAPAAMRSGLRFRRGSRAPMRTGEIPLIGVVNMEPTEVAAPEAAPQAAAEAPADKAPAKRPRKSSSRAKAAKGPKVATAMETAPAAPEAKPEGKPVRKRARPRAKKAE
jgi:hypothetical protein